MCVVSDLIPVHNGAEFIDATLAAVRGQIFENLQIVVVVDDGSTDESVAAVRAHAGEDLRISLIRQPNRGVAKVRNAGIDAARGDWIATVDADDLWHPEKIARQVQAAEAAADRPGMIYCWSRRIDASDAVLCDLGAPSFEGDVYGPLAARNFMVNASAVMLRRDVVERIGGFDPGLQAAGAHGAEDLGLYPRAAALTPADPAKGPGAPSGQPAGLMAECAAMRPALHGGPQEHVRTWAGCHLWRNLGDGSASCPGCIRRGCSRPSQRFRRCG